MSAGPRKPGNFLKKMLDLEIPGIFFKALVGYFFEKSLRYDIFVKERPSNKKRAAYCKFVKNNIELYISPDFKKSDIGVSYHHMQQSPRRDLD